MPNTGVARCDECGQIVDLPAEQCPKCKGPIIPIVKGDEEGDEED